MPQVRELLKRHIPSDLRERLVALRGALAPPPVENGVLHDYDVVATAEARPRISLVIPNVSAKKAFGGVTTGIDILLELGKRADADIRIVLDDLGAPPERDLIDGRARRLGLDPATIEVTPRTTRTPRLEVRATDVFMPHNWWTTLNIRSVVRRQAAAFSVQPQPYIYLIQEYEPQFYAFSSTHMMARQALDGDLPYWGVFNSTELFDYYRAQGHAAERAFVFEPRLATSLRPFLDGGAPVKQKRILVYGRPTVPRNCFPAVEKGLKRWLERFPERADWEVVSAGLPHRPIPLGRGVELRSLGKLPLDGYADLLRTTAVGLSLMASPHPSYPPLEMAHFGVRTITNSYANKDLTRAHPNITSISDILPDTLATALEAACAGFEQAPEAGWAAQTSLPGFLAPGGFEFLDEVADALRSKVWRGTVTAAA